MGPPRPRRPAASIPAIVSHGARTLVKSVAKASKDKLFGGTSEGGGELLVEQKAISRDEIEKTVQEQASLRTQKLGELLLAEGDVLRRG